GPAAQPPPEHFGVGAGRGRVLTDHPLLARSLGHRLPCRTADVVVGAFPGEGITECGVGARHAPSLMRPGNAFYSDALCGLASSGSPASSRPNAERATVTASRYKASAAPPAVMARPFSCARTRPTATI